MSRAPLAVQRFASVLLLTFFLDSDIPREHGFFAVQRQQYPEYFAAALALHRNQRLAQLNIQQAPFDLAWDMLVPS